MCRKFVCLCHWTGNCDLSTVSTMTIQNGSPLWCPLSPVAVSGQEHTHVLRGKGRILSGSRLGGSRWGGRFSPTSINSSAWHRDNLLSYKAHCRRMGEGSLTLRSFFKGKFNTFWTKVESHGLLHECRHPAQKEQNPSGYKCMQKSLNIPCTTTWDLKVTVHFFWKKIVNAAMLIL